LAGKVLWEECICADALDEGEAIAASAGTEAAGADSSLDEVDTAADCTDFTDAATGLDGAEEVDAGEGEERDTSVCVVSKKFTLEEYERALGLLIEDPERKNIPLI
jgi:hypothetical protein